LENINGELDSLYFLPILGFFNQRQDRLDMWQKGERREIHAGF
jgi:hypothetical protein